MHKGKAFFLGEPSCPLCLNGKSTLKKLRAALISSAPIYGDISRNLVLLEEHVKNSAKEGAELVCFPEMSLTGYGRTPEITSLAQPVGGFAVRELQKIAKTYGVAILAGLPLKENSQNKPRISQVFCAPDGTCSTYHKTHLSQREAEVFSPGNNLGLVSWLSIKFGLQLCLDTHFPELSLAQASQGVQILLMSFASPMDTPQTLRARWLRFLPARAYDSGCFVLVCNQAGKSPVGKEFGHGSF